MESSNSYEFRAVKFLTASIFSRPTMGTEFRFQAADSIGIISSAAARSVLDSEHPFPPGQLIEQDRKKGDEVGAGDYWKYVFCQRECHDCQDPAEAEHGRRQVGSQD